MIERFICGHGKVEDNVYRGSRTRCRACVSARAYLSSHDELTPEALVEESDERYRDNVPKALDPEWSGW